MDSSLKPNLFPALSVNETAGDPQRPLLVRAIAWLLFPLVVLGRDSLSQDAVSKHPAPGTKIVHFSQVDDGIYKGSKPKTDEDFRFLQSKHIRYILDLNFLPLFSISEKRKSRKYGTVFLRVPMNASPIAPSEKHVNEALSLLRDKRFHPIYFHCELGRDRTSVVAALYDVYFRGMSQKEAWVEMKASGYKD